MLLPGRLHFTCTRTHEHTCYSRADCCCRPTTTAIIDLQPLNFSFNYHFLRECADQRRRRNRLSTSTRRSISVPLIQAIPTDHVAQHSFPHISLESVRPRAVIRRTSSNPLATPTTLHLRRQGQRLRHRHHGATDDPTAPDRRPSHSRLRAEAAI